MKMTVKILCCILYMFVLVIINGSRAQNPDVGRIFVGTQGNRSDPTAYTFNSNIAVSQSIPFSAVVFSGADGSEITKTDDITVTCESAVNGVDGYTQAPFTPVILAAAATEGSVSFSVLTAGRTATVRCYGVSTSVTPGTVCPATAQFCKDTSMSDPIGITLTPAPVVSICQPVNTVPNFSTATYDGSFQVVLSEAVRSSNVTVTCQIVNPSTLNYCLQPGVNCCTPSNIAAIVSTVNVPEGQNTATVRYQVTWQNQKTCFAVRCAAQSLSQLPEGYFQYLPGSSQSISSEGLFESISPAVYMEPQFFSAYNTSFQSLLYMDANTDTDVPFQCQATVVGSVEEAVQRTTSIDCSFIFATSTVAPTTPAPTTPAPPVTTDANATTSIPSPQPTPPIDPSSPWLAVDSSFTVRASGKFFAVRTARVLAVIAPVKEIVVTTCCSTVTGATSSYSGLSIATVAVAELNPPRNNTGGVTTGQAGSERFVVNPAYREVAPCPCDLTYLQCDINCCCDTECTDIEKQTFSSCIAGRFGGQDPGPNLRNCKSDHFLKDDWFPMMCVQFESNALLGEFYQNTQSLTTATQINDKLVAEKKSNVYIYRETEPRFSDLAVVSGYKEGFKILTISSQGNAGNLPLPQRTSSGKCLDSTPVQFLRNSDSTCIRTLTQDTCADLTPFSSRVYAQASSLYNPACPRSYSISSTGQSLQDENQRVNVLVNYYCTTNNAAYVKTTTTNFFGVVVPTTVYRFRPGLENLNCTDLCGGNSSCLDYNQGLGVSDSGTAIPRCDYDIGFILPNAPSFNAVVNRCEDVVFEVKYRFTWAGTAITGLTVDVVVGDIPLTPGGQASVSQKFSTVFEHDYSGSSSQIDNIQNVTTAYQRSGRPGYNFGKPVDSGCRSINATTGETLPVDRNEINQMAVWQADFDGLCQSTKRRFLTFGDDMQSSCNLRLTINEINDCDSLRDLVLKQLNVLMPANVVGRYGYNSPEIQDMWIDVIRDDPFPSEATSTVAPTTTAANPTVAASSSLPTTEQNVTFDPLSVRGGICQNVANGIQLHIMYAKTGQNKRYPLLEIVGVSVRYSVSNWSMSCVGSNSVRCLNNSNTAQSFLVHSSVQYTMVPATRPEKPILFYEKYKKESCDSDSCYRFYQDFDTSICHYDTCWHELFYPLIKSYQGSEGVLYTRAVSLVFVLFILGFISVTKPWK